MMESSLLKAIEKIEHASKRHGLFCETSEDDTKALLVVYADARKKEEIVKLLFDYGKNIKGHVGGHPINQAWMQDFGVISGLSVAQIEITAKGLGMGDTLVGMLRKK